MIRQTFPLPNIFGYTIIYKYVNIIEIISFIEISFGSVIEIQVLSLLYTPTVIPAIAEL